jgi:hypothetical protein
MKTFFFHILDKHFIDGLAGDRARVHDVHYMISGMKNIGITQHQK